MDFFKKIFKKKWKITETRALGLLVFLCVAGLVAGLFQLSRDINTPFSTPIFEFPEDFEIPEFQDLIKTDKEKRLESMEELQATDTDEDGISNYDELYIYTTSPYLYDSDSDGIDDKTEIETGEDPNCPKGQSCNLAYYQPSDQGIDETAAELNPDDLRATLQGVGVPQTLLDALNNEELNQLYQETVSETGVDVSSLTGNTNGAPVENSQEITYEMLMEFEAPQIRSLLMDAGLDEEALSQVDDETLEFMYEKAIFGAGDLETLKESNDLDINF